jgi:hypothetical protein
MYIYIYIVDVSIYTRLYHRNLKSPAFCRIRRQLIDQGDELRQLLAEPTARQSPGPPVDRKARWEILRKLI